MTKGVRVLSRLQLPPELLARFRADDDATTTRRPTWSSTPAATC